MIIYMNKAGYSIKVIFFSLFLILFASTVSAETAEKKKNLDVRRPEAMEIKAQNRACAAKESAIKIRMTQLTRLVVTMETTFDKIAERTKSYYTSKVLVSGKTVSNHDSLVNDIAVKKEAIQTALNQAKADISSFSCATSDPKTTLNQFNLNMKLVKDALKNYRTSVNNLIVAVKSASKSTETTRTK